MTGENQATELAGAAMQLAFRALEFGEIPRTACQHPDGRPETDATHTVMLTWLAPALADLLYPELDPELVAAFAAVHDAVEVYAGDTPTLRITPAGREAKKAREAARRTPVAGGVRRHAALAARHDRPVRGPA